MTFDKIINRKNTGSVKWDMLKSLFGDESALPMWVADMDFENPMPVKEALTKLIDEEILGYTFPRDSLYASIIKWQAEHHNMILKKEHILFSPGVLSSIATVIQALTAPGDGVLIHDPVYTPFSTMVEKNNRTVYRSTLIKEQGQYKMNYEDIKLKMRTLDIKLFILSNPHNPGGRVWSEEELKTLVEICIKHDILLISDEIHSDLVYEGYKCISPVTLDDRYKKSIITLHSATKTFNIAGIKTSFIMVFDNELKMKLSAIQHQTELDSVNTFGMCATEAAFSNSNEWREDLLRYLESNRATILTFFDHQLPEVEYMVPEATYLFWFDASTLNIAPDRLKTLFAKEGKIALNDGISYGPNGQAYMRLNFAVPHSVLLDGLNRIKSVFVSYSK